MKDLKLARALLKAAYRDVKALNAMLDSSVFADEIFGSMCNRLQKSR